MVLDHASICLCAMRTNIKKCAVRAQSSTHGKESKMSTNKLKSRTVITTALLAWALTSFTALAAAQSASESSVGAPEVSDTMPTDKYEAAIAMQPEAARSNTT